MLMWGVREVLRKNCCLVLISVIRKLIALCVQPLTPVGFLAVPGVTTSMPTLPTGLLTAHLAGARPPAPAPSVCMDSAR